MHTKLMAEGIVLGFVVAVIGAIYLFCQALGGCDRPRECCPACSQEPTP